MGIAVHLITVYAHSAKVTSLSLTKLGFENHINIWVGTIMLKLRDFKTYDHQDSFIQG